MKKKMFWLLMTCLMVLSLLITSCGQARTAQTTPTASTAPVATTVPAAPTASPTSTIRSTEKPKYGGVLRVGRQADIKNFDDIIGLPYQAITTMITNETLWGGDWAKGPAGGYGSNETDWAGPYDRWEHKAGYVAESWEFKVTREGGTLIWHIRKGVRFALNPASEASRLVGGREVTADDVVFSLKQTITDPRAYLYKGNPELKVAKITATDQWTVKIELPWEAFVSAVTRFADNVFMVPPEVVKKYGVMTDWKVSVGTGPFMLTDFVPASSATLERNSNYWMKDPIGPGKGNQLPYLDGVKILIIPDISTQYAALRTAKIDAIGGGSGVSDVLITQEDAASLTKTTPQLISRKLSQASITPVYIRSDKPPFSDVRVRRAMLMAIDFEGMNKNLYNGDAQIVTWPIAKVKGYEGAYLGLDDPEMSESVRELYSYKPEKARTLLKEAGYPQGFKTQLIFVNKTAEVDYYSLYKDMWAKIGVDVELRPTESAALATIYRAKTQEALNTADQSPIAILYQLKQLRGDARETGLSNGAFIDDARIKEAYPQIQWLAATDPAAADRLYKELMKYVLDQAWAIPKLMPPVYVFWWPWLKNYSGEVSVGYIHRNYLNWVWLDQELKKSMGF